MIKFTKKVEPAKKAQAPINSRFDHSNEIASAKSAPAKTASRKGVTSVEKSTDK